MRFLAKATALILSACWMETVWAYIGPGLGIGTISAILGLVTTFFLALFTILFYPVKRLLRKRKEARESVDKD